MKRLVILAAAIAAFTACAGNPEAPKRTFELPEKTDLPQDMAALQEAQTGWWAKSMENVDERTEWYRLARFGCFVHWGVYSQAGGQWEGRIYNGYAEHLMRMAKIPVETYRQTLVKSFNPVGFDADKWMDDVVASGMKYFIITSKHHDGFAMFPSEAYPYDIRLSGYKGDPMRELRDAARRHGIKFGFYYSHAFDWEHPDAPGNDWDWDHPGGDRKLGGTNWWNTEYASFLPNAEKYVKEKSIPQIRELVRNYDPDIMWFDTPGKLPLYLNVEVLKALREVDTDCKIVVNGRLARFGSYNLGDYKSTSDRAAHFYPVEGLWESIPTTNESYGYNAWDNSHKAPGHFIRLLEDAVSRGGNILMNVGPMGDGRWNEKDLNIFHTVGKWLSVNGESIYGAGSDPLPLQPWGVTTMRGDTLYLHIHKWPSDGTVTVGGLDCKISKGWVVGSPSASVTWNKSGASDSNVKIAGAEADSVSTVVALILKGTPSEGTTGLLEPGEENILYAFDANLVGGGFDFGDGKRNRNYVKNWKNDSQYFTWDFRMPDPAAFEVLLDYNTAENADSGEVCLDFGQEKLHVTYSPSLEKNGTATLSAGKVELPQGQITCTLKGVRHDGAQYMQPIAVRLVPVR